MIANPSEELANPLPPTPLCIPPNTKPSDFAGALPLLLPLQMLPLQYTT